MSRWCVMVVLVHCRGQSSVRSALALVAFGWGSALSGLVVFSDEAPKIVSAKRSRTEGLIVSGCDV